ncbi:NAD(P)-dependent oxidoreductase [Sphingomonas oligophenolica]|uniref:NAD(P)-dependent oxidoreductase n=1 Tax=Sphingomonas oligophenolica TaxID=301154 RepID=A0ABU9XXT0_9SPHN
MHIGFIGLGQMGSAIAANLVKTGHDVKVWNRSPEKAAPLVAAGATLAASPADAASGEVVLTMLADDMAVEAVTFGEDGILAAPNKPIHVSLSTISFALAEKLTAAHAEASGSFVAAPVFGRPAAAAAAKLFVVAAGPAQALAACTPLFEAIGQKTFPLGHTPSAATIVKLSGNFLILSVIESLAEAMTLAEKHGVEKAALLEILTGTLFGAPIYQVYGKILVDQSFRPAGFAAPLGLKDMNLVAAAATDARVPMPVLSLLRDRLLATIAREGDDIDWSGIARTVADNAGPAS